jgi:hypothetical protein
MSYSVGIQPFEINNLPEQSNAPCCPRICNGRTFKLADKGFEAVEIILIGLAAYGVFETYLNPSEHSDFIYAFCIGEVVLTLSLAVISEIFFCAQGYQQKKRKMVNPFILLTTAMFGGALATEVSYALANRTIQRIGSNESSDLTHAYNVLENAPVKEMWMAAPISGFVALGYEILIRHLKKNPERRRLLEV